MKTSTKTILTVTLLIATTLIFNAFEPSIAGQVAVQQLNDSYASTAGMTTYQSVKNWFWITYIVVPVLVFFSDIKKLFKKN
jgi:hypothetical protein